jgi:acetylglutamate kinase
MVWRLHQQGDRRPHQRGGEWAIGLSGKDGNMVFAEKARRTLVDPDSKIEEIVDLGLSASRSKSTAPCSTSWRARK